MFSKPIGCNNRCKQAHEWSLSISWHRAAVTSHKCRLVIGMGGDGSGLGHCRWLSTGIKYKLGSVLP